MLKSNSLAPSEATHFQSHSVESMSKKIQQPSSAAGSRANLSGSSQGLNKVMTLAKAYEPRNRPANGRIGGGSIIKIIDNKIADYVVSPPPAPRTPIVSQTNVNFKNEAAQVRIHAAPSPHSAMPSTSSSSITPFNRPTQIDVNFNVSCG